MEREIQVNRRRDTSEFRSDGALNSSSSVGIDSKAFTEAISSEGKNQRHESTEAQRAKTSLIESEGGCVGSSAAGRLYRPANPLTGQAIRNQIAKGKIIAYRAGGARFRVPVWQFREQGGLVEGLEEANKKLMETLPGATTISSFLFFLRPQIQTKGDVPLHALQVGRIDEVMKAVEAAQF